MDKYLLALLGEAGASGLAKGIYSVRKEERFKRAYENEIQHWNYFRKYRRNILEKPVYYLLYLVGVITALLGYRAIKYVVNKAESGALDFYIKNFEVKGDIEKIVEDEKHHFIS
ncbi:hypothetical protein [Stygiolobus caldivivus]|uniref:Uncharacterized protein n=1 Tax=Stygiolobus caldivivus TaxID=2824673 RepID=A0A8D5U5R0_9CREN|nr:hypothetical protein [Stygiolobus caldivivus]BCU69560.1 hypothetical protein KN1_08570 [Stygiolobus caldivivus]